MSATQIPEPPDWVKDAGKEAVWAWNSSEDWRADAARATSPKARECLIAQAKDAYYN